MIVDDVKAFVIEYKAFVSGMFILMGIITFGIFNMACTTYGTSSIASIFLIIGYGIMFIDDRNETRRSNGRNGDQ